MLEEMLKLEQELNREIDGIDFVPLNFNFFCSPQSKIFQSNTREDIINGFGYPRTQWCFFIIEDGLKKYVKLTKDI